MKQILIILSLLLATTASAQRKTPQLKRQWDEGRLTYDDFRGRPSLSADGSHAEFFLGYSIAHDTTSGLLVDYPRADATMKPYQSWMLPSHRNSTTLRYHQLQFDLLEAERRRLQLSLLKGDDYGDALLDSAFFHLGQRLDSLKTSTSEGGDSTALSLWEEHTSQLLASLPPVSPLHFHQQWLLEIGVGGGLQFFTGTLNDDFSSGFSFNFMIDMLYGRHMMAMDIGVGVLAARDTVWNVDDYFYTNLPVNDIHALVEYGYRLVDHNRWSLTPFVGGGFHRLDQSEDNITFGAVTGTLAAGILFQRRSMMDISMTSSNTAERYDLDFTGKITVTHSQFNHIDGKPSGFGIYLQVGAAVGWGRYIVTQ